MLYFIKKNIQYLYNRLHKVLLSLYHICIISVDIVTVYGNIIKNVALSYSESIIFTDITCSGLKR